ncbi:alpha/beta hydrolase [Gallaecimonas sp. GXIMD4217]|uniref:alpha/beta hydrolase n=1 Tax=Gallaecimonas sp. GXIMD4217 TaxID=3131927 RepID=UPI00311B363D
MTQRSLYIDRGDHRLHLRHMGPEDGSGPVVLMLHGAISNGKVFYSESGKGLGPFLAGRGFQVYVAELRGRGLSLPAIEAGHDYGQTDAIVAELPAMQAFIRERHPGQKVHWLAHSWGGVLMASCLARFPGLAEQVASLTFFGSKRCIRRWSWERLLKVELVWKRLGPYWVRKHGYLPARQLRIGADSETVESLLSSVAWVKPGPWVDPQDGFDYGAGAARVDWPRSWFIAGARDRVLGHPGDVADFRAEMGAAGPITVLGRKQGFEKDFGHLDMLVGPGLDGLFAQVADWLSGAAPGPEHRPGPHSPR